MRLVKAYRFRLEPTPAAAREMARVAGCCRCVLERAYRNFFEGRAGRPRFKKKGLHDAFRCPDPKQFVVDGHGRVKLPKRGWEAAHEDRAHSP